MRPGSGPSGPARRLPRRSPRLPGSVRPRSGSTIGGGLRLAPVLDGQPGDRGFVQGFGGFDLDAEPGEPDIGARARGVEPDRRNIEIAQDLGAEPDLAPLPAAFEF